jgi:hypothetical protein
VVVAITRDMKKPVTSMVRLGKRIIRPNTRRVPM